MKEFWLFLTKISWLSLFGYNWLNMLNWLPEDIDNFWLLSIVASCLLSTFILGAFERAKPSR